MTVAEWLQKEGFVYDEAAEMWMVPGAANPKDNCIPKSLVDQAEADAGIATILFNDHRLRLRTQHRGVDQHPRIREWTRKGRIE